MTPYGRCRSLFDRSQVLAWLAGDRADIQEQLSWREQIAGLLKPFIPHLVRRGSA